MARLDPKAGIAAGLGVAASLVIAWEGMRNDPYADLVGKMTVCVGETRVPMRHYTDAECRELLDKGLQEFTQGVLKRSPELAGHPYQLGATVSLAYNIGLANYSRSTVAKRFAAGDWKGACDAFLAWHYAGGKPVKGLLNRRKAERAVCLRGLS